MPIQFTCPHCGAETNVSDQYAGHTGPCASCGKPITVPALPGSHGPAPSPRRSSGMPIVVVIVIVLGVLLVCGGILAALLLPVVQAVQAGRGAARRVQCTNNLKQLGLAMHNYHDVYKSFPPAYIADENGTPMHSWRVLLLPYLEPGLYEMYDFDEPWDGPNNSALAPLIASTYQCASDPSPGAETNYVMIVGPGTISDGTGTNGFRNITDGTSNTIMLVEVTGSGINWMEPRDLNADEISFEINDPFDPGIGSNHPGVANVLMCDGSVHFLPEETDPETIKAMTTIAGGEPAFMP